RRGGDAWPKALRRRASVRGDLQVAADRTRDSRALQPAIPLGVLGKVLLVVILGVVEPWRVADFRRDRTHARSGEPGLVRTLGFFGHLTLFGVSGVDDGP